MIRLFDELVVEMNTASGLSPHTPRAHRQRRNASASPRFEMTRLHLHTLKWQGSWPEGINILKNAALPISPEPRQYTTRQLSRMLVPNFMNVND
jgi:hypothetical protein